MENEHQDIYTEEELGEIAELLDAIKAVRRRLFTEGEDVDGMIKEFQETGEVV